LAAGVDHHGERSPVGVFAQVPTGGPGELAAACDRAGVGHAAEAKVGRIGQHGGEHNTPVIRRHTRVQVGECIGEPGPAMHVGH
jgi:hypothetical protein